MEELAQLLANLEEEELLARVAKQLEAGTSPVDIMEACRQGMNIIGKRFEKGEYFLSELIMAGEIFKHVGELVTPHLTNCADAPKRGRVVIGTVQGDIHDIGKDLVVTMLKCANYDVLDLGVDIPPARFVEAVRSTGASVVGLSGLLTVSFESMKETVSALKDAGLPVKVMIGGGPTNEQVRQYVGADAWGADAQAAVNLCNQWMEG